MTDVEVREERDAYDGAIAYLDQSLAELAATLARRGLSESTLIVITSDHGEEFDEHGVFEHGYSLYLPSLRVPLVIRWPGRVPAGRRVEVPVSLRDLPATIVDLVGLSRASPFPGQSLARYWRSGAAERPANGAIRMEVSRADGQPPWFPTSRGDMQAVVVHGMHYIRNGDGGEELYRIVSDPWERQDLASSSVHRDDLHLLRAMLQAGAPAP
jgi:arylsulfatase A-like enzyme